MMSKMGAPVSGTSSLVAGGYLWVRLPCSCGAYSEMGTHFCVLQGAQELALLLLNCLSWGKSHSSSVSLHTLNVSVAEREGGEGCPPTCAPKKQQAFPCSFPY